MLFSSLIFLFLFLPVTLLIYYVLRGRARNYWLLAASLVFFAWGGVTLTLLLAVSITVNYFFGLAVDRHRGGRTGYRWLAAGVIFNVLLLAIFKYANFFSAGLSSLAANVGNVHFSPTNIVLPVGISFYTFHALSYLVDIYRGKCRAQHNIVDLALYISMFSQLVAGPIVRYSDVWMQLRERSHNILRFGSGVERFLIGLARKVLLANTFAQVADGIMVHDPSELYALQAWLGIICYTLQIYHDFAGYSDMAIGLGRMFGFEFMENFNFPYTAGSVKEFWRRWHISLSSFFRDYVYIPLGGNRVQPLRQYVNLVAVFLLTGLWHGANVTFIVWGLFHGLFLLLERLGWERVLALLPRIAGQVYTMLVVIFAWVLFRLPDIDMATGYWKAMFRLEGTPAQFESFLSFMNPSLYVMFIIAVLGAVGFFRSLSAYSNSAITKSRSAMFAYDAGSAIFYAGILIVCSLYLVSGSYNPFIYFRF